MESAGEETSGHSPPPQNLMGTLENINLRLKDMDEAEIDMQVLSWSGGVRDSNDRNAILSSKKINDILANVIRKYPNRFAAFSNIPCQDQEAAVAELERAVKELGLKGIKINGIIEGEYLDSKKLWPVLKKAEELGTPVFLHIGTNGIGFVGYSAVDRVLFGVDFPTDSNKESVEFIESAPILNDSDKEKIYHLNAERLFGI